MSRSDETLTEDDWAEIHRKREAERVRSTRDPDVLLPLIRDRLGLRCKLQRITRTDAESPNYRIDTTEGVVRLPSGGSPPRWMTRPGDFRAAFTVITGEVLPRLKGPDFDEVCAMIVRAAEVEDIGEEATSAGLGVAWLRGYLNSVVTLRDVSDLSLDALDDSDLDLDLHLMHGVAVRHGEHVHITSEGLRRWLVASRAEKPSYPRLGEVLRAAGCVPGRLDQRRGGERKQTRTWVIPAFLVPPDLL